MTSKYLSLIAALALIAAPLRAQDNPLNDPDLQKMLQQAQELQKSSTPASMSDLKKRMEEMQKEAKKIEAEQNKQEKAEKAALQKRLEKQLAESGPAKLPDWTPATPQFTATGSLVKKINDEQVKTVQTGTSTATPQAIGDAWQAGVADKEVNKSLNNITVNGEKTIVLFLSTRTEPREELEMEAKRDPGGKVTKVTITSALPKPEEEDSE